MDRTREYFWTTFLPASMDLLVYVQKRDMYLTSFPKINQMKLRGIAKNLWLNDYRALAVWQLKS